MIIADVFVPSIDRTYNFSLDENVPVSSLVEELIGMVEQREQATFAGPRTAVALVDRRSSSVLPPENTLRECYVVTGSMLILV